MYFQPAAVAALAGLAQAAPALRRDLPSEFNAWRSDLHIGTPATSTPSSSRATPTPSHKPTRTNGTATTPPGGFKQVSYWGQAYESPLPKVCEQPIDNVVLSFVNEYGNMTDGRATMNAGWQCDTHVDKLKDSYTKKQCESLGNDIKTCQSKGKKVLMSIGGWTDYSTIKNNGGGKALADSLWQLYGAGTGDDKPLGKDVVLDGFDFDIEHDNDKDNNAGYVDTIKELRSLAQKANKQILITGAPMSVPVDFSIPNAMTTMMKEAKFDELYFQFYNNPGFSCNSTDDTKKAWDYWYNQLQKGESKAAKMFLGIPGGIKAAGDGLTDPTPKGDPYFLEADKMMALVNEMKTHKAFAGVMTWDVSNSMNSTTPNGKNYFENIDAVLKSSKLA